MVEQGDMLQMLP